ARLPRAAMPSGLSKPYRRPSSARISAPLAALISDTESPPSFATHSRAPRAARAAGSLKPSAVPARTLIPAPVVAFISVTERPPTFATHSRGPARASAYRALRTANQQNESAHGGKLAGWLSSGIHRT